MLSASRISFEVAARTRAIAYGGIGVMVQLARRTGLVAEINRRVRVLQRHQPYHESDHVLNIAFNALCGGTCLEDLELRRNDESFLDAVGAMRWIGSVDPLNQSSARIPHAQDVEGTHRVRIHVLSAGSTDDEIRPTVAGQIFTTIRVEPAPANAKEFGVWEYVLDQDTIGIAQSFAGAPVVNPDLWIPHRVYRSSRRL